MKGNAEHVCPVKTISTYLSLYCWCARCSTWSIRYTKL